MSYPAMTVPPGAQTVRVLEAWSPSPLTRAIRVERPPGLNLVASQALRLVLTDELMRPMTIASGPERPHLDFAVQRSDSEFKRRFFALGEGDTLRVGPPRGAFILERGRPALMIASGIGITPFRSMLEALIDEGGALTGALLHATRGPRDVPFAEQVDASAPQVGLRLHRQTGPVSADTLAALGAQVPDALWYLSGPVEDVSAWAEALGALGVERANLRLEAFRYTGSLSEPEEA